MSDKKHTIHDVARKVLDLCNERVESYKAHLIELSKVEKNFQHEVPATGLQHEVAKQPDAAPNMGLQHEVPKMATGLQHEVPSAPMAMKVEKSALPGELAHHTISEGTSAVAKMPTPPAVPPQLKSEMGMGCYGKKPKLPRKASKKI